MTGDQRVSFCPHCGEPIVGMVAVSRGGLTRMQRVCLDAIARLTVADVAPTYLDIARELKRTKSSAFRLVHGLEERGYVALGKGARSIRILPQGGIRAAAA